MAADFWMYLAPVAALAGAGIGALAMRRRGNRAAPDLGDELARMRAQLEQAQLQAAADVTALQKEFQRRLEAAIAAHREEADKLKKHLAAAFDEMEQLRHQARRSAAPGAPDTGQGFAATMPLGDV